MRIIAYYDIIPVLNILLQGTLKALAHFPCISIEKCVYEQNETSILLTIS